jgi:hypothetical protein
MRQQTLFEKQTGQPEVDAEQLAFYALGEFQARGKALAERDLPLDRLRGALKRTCELFGVEELEDERAVVALESIGAQIRRVQPFVAKHPFRVIVPTELAQRALASYRETLEKEAADRKTKGRD